MCREKTLRQSIKLNFVATYWSVFSRREFAARTWLEFILHRSLRKKFIYLNRVHSKREIARGS